MRGVLNHFDSVQYHICSKSGKVMLSVGSVCQIIPTVDHCRSLEKFIKLHTVQGGPSGHALAFVDIKTNVLSQYIHLI